MCSETRTKGDEPMAFNYNKLRGRIREICGTQEEFSKLLGISRTSLSQRLNNILNFSNKEILKACQILKIKTEEIPAYFFTPKVQKSEQE